MIFRKGYVFDCIENLSKEKLLERFYTYSSEELLNKIEHVDITKLEGFSALISDLFTDCDVFEPDSALRKDYEISEEEFRNCVKETFLKIKNCKF